jgi:DNA polymerase eta
MNSAFKGKAKEPPSDPVFTDLNPIITYKHLLTPYTSVKHPLRVVALCDGDAFYAGCERKRLNLDWDIPLVVNQWGMVIAVNYPARSYGISRIDKIPDCVKRCPHLKIVHVATYAEGEDEAKYWKNPNIKTHKVRVSVV